MWVFSWKNNRIPCEAWNTDSLYWSNTLLVKQPFSSLFFWTSLYFEPIALFRLRKQIKKSGSAPPFPSSNDLFYTEMLASSADLVKRIFLQLPVSFVQWAIWKREFGFNVQRNSFSLQRNVSTASIIFFFVTRTCQKSICFSVPCVLVFVIISAHVNFPQWKCLPTTRRHNNIALRR